MANEKLLDEAKRRFKLAQEAEDAQRQREKDDLRFQVPEEQWDEEARRQRQSDIVDGVQVPPRPVLSIPRIDQPIQLVTNQERSAQLGIDIAPLSADADKDTAKLLEGIYRSIERDSQAHIARSWAYDRAVKCGRGVYRVTTVYDDTTPDPLDQVIRIERILHQSSVYFDPAATKPDYSDGEFAFLTTWMSLDTFKRHFPKSEVPIGDPLAWENLVEESPGWVRGDHETGAVLVAEYFYKKHDIEEITYESLGIEGEGIARRKDNVSVKICKLSGFEILEQADWNGKYIPLIPVHGRELQPYDEERRWTGIIGPAKDAQRLYNYAASGAVEMAALEPRAPFMADPRQTEGYKEMWRQLNTRNFPVLYYNASIDEGGQLLPAPARVPVDANRLGPNMLLLQQADNFIQQATYTFDPSLGRLSEQEASGRKVLALQQQSEAGNSHYLQNLAQISMPYEAKVILDLVPKIYDRPGRIMRTLNAEGESDTILLGQRFFTDGGGFPTPLEDGAAPPQMPVPPNAPPGTEPAMPKVKMFDLQKGIYSVAISVGKQRQTALQEGAEELGQLLQARPELLPLLGPKYFEYRQWPGSDDVKDILQKVRDKQFPFLAEDDEGMPTPEQMRAQMEQMGQRLEMLQAQLGQAVKAIETEEVKRRADLEKAQLDSQTKIAIASMKDKTERELAGLKVQMEGVSALLKQLAGQREREHDTIEREEDRAHEIASKAAEKVMEPSLEYRGGGEPLEGGE